MFSSRALFPNQNPENQVRAQPSASRGGPESDPPSRVSGRAASAWQRAKSSSHHRSDWAELTISMGSRNTMSDRESSCRNTRRGPGPGFRHGFSLDSESTSQRAIADERSQAAVSVAQMCHSRLLNSDPKPKNISRLSCLLLRVVYCSRRDTICMRTVRQNDAKIMRTAKGSSVPFHLRRKEWDKV